MSAGFKITNIPDVLITITVTINSLFMYVLLRFGEIAY